MNRSNIPRADLRIEVLNDNGDKLIRLFLDEPPWADMPKKVVATPFNYPDLIDKARLIYDRVNELVYANNFSREALRDIELRTLLSQLNNDLYSLRFKNFDRNLGAIFNAVITKSATPINLIVDAEAGLIPWELSSPSRELDREKMLGSLVFIAGRLWTTPSEDLRDRTQQIAERPIDWGRASFAFDREVEIRAAGNSKLKGASAEAALIEKPQSPIARGKVADPIVSLRSEPAFFSHFGPEGYDLIHFYSHCDYTTKGFTLKVSNSYNLKFAAFTRHDAQFKAYAFHFLNVCSGAPTPRTRQRSFLEYMGRQQNAGGVLASLVAVRSQSAVDIAQNFYEHFIPKCPTQSGETVGKALSAAREALWNAGSAAGYLYRIYGRPDAALTPIDLKFAQRKTKDV